MKISGVVYIVVGVIAVIGAIIAAYVLFNVGQMLSTINNSNPSEIPAGTDLTALKASIAPLNFWLMPGWIFTISFLLSGIISARTGVGILRKKSAAKVTSLKR